jgi:hypothetical protein
VIAQPMSVKRMKVQIESSDSKLICGGKFKLKFGWLYYFRESKLQYFFSNATWLGIAKVALKMLLHDLRHRTLATVIFFFLVREFRIREGESNLIVADVNGELSPIWVSRQAILGDVKSPFIDETIDYDFYRKVSVIQIRIWATSFTPSIFKPWQSIPNASVYQASILNTKNPNSTKLQLVEIHNGVVHHGKIVSQKNKLLPLSITDFVNTNSWPSDRPIVFNGQTHLLDCKHSIELEEAVFLGTSTSWYHFMVEYIPRYFFIPQSQREITTLIPLDTPPQFIELLTVIGFKNLIKTERFELIKLKNLTSVLDYRYSNPFDFLSRRADLLMLQDFFANLEIPFEASMNYERILIRRPKSTFRQMKNEKEVCEALMELGFFTIYPEQLSFSQQLTLFRNAKLIVAQSGAAFTSILFNKKDSLTIELGNWDKSQEQTFWRDFANVLELRIYSMCAKPKSLTARISDSFECDLPKLVKFVKEI